MTPSLLIVLGAAALFAILAVYRFLATRSIPRVDPSTASERIRRGEAVLLDVRTDAERRAGTIRGSSHIPLQELRRREAELKKFGTKEIICFCQTGSRSISAAVRLRSFGLTASSLEGGIGEWNFVHRPRH